MTVRGVRVPMLVIHSVSFAPHEGVSDGASGVVLDPFAVALSGIDVYPVIRCAMELTRAPVVVSARVLPSLPLAVL